MPLQTYANPRLRTRAEWRILLAPVVRGLKTGARALVIATGLFLGTPVIVGGSVKIESEEEETMTVETRADDQERQDFLDLLAGRKARLWREYATTLTTARTLVLDIKDTLYRLVNRDPLAIGHADVGDSIGLGNQGAALVRLLDQLAQQTAQIASTNESEQLAIAS